MSACGDSASSTCQFAVEICFQSTPSMMHVTHIRFEWLSPSNSVVLVNNNNDYSCVFVAHSLTDDDDDDDDVCESWIYIVIISSNGADSSRLTTTITNCCWWCYQLASMIKILSCRLLWYSFAMVVVCVNLELLSNQRDWSLFVYLFVYLGCLSRCSNIELNISTESNWMLLSKQS